ncbi:MAG: hypothetical protein M4579_004768 [Chaenotheca gracillima]|nr:MAG: hypothetical protein M4579_004768 [Chaenotheca gracillima]
MRYHLGVVLPLIAAVAAVPVELEKRSVSDQQLAQFELFSQYAGASYCTGNNDSPNTKVTCPSGNCPLVEAADATTTTEFENTLLTDTTGFVAIDNTNKLVVLSFRGSTSVRSFITDGEFLQGASDLCLGCLAHKGFYLAWQEIKGTVLPAIKSAAQANPDFTVIVTGHSLGGAIADFAAAELRKAGQAATLYTFGAPRVGNDILSRFLTNQGNNYRVTHTDDPVPKLPPLALGFTHLSPEYHIESGDDTVSASNINEYTGTINLSGNTGTGGFDVNAHLHYFGPISACSPGLQLVK